MTFAPGSALGPCEIVAPIGAGGMSFPIDGPLDCSWVLIGA
jgi:hypothetical protein